MINKELTDEEKYNIGEELRDRTLANGDNWKIVYVSSTNTTYGTGWNYIDTGTILENYGETKYRWVINYDTGDVIRLSNEANKYQYGDNLAVKDGLILNADPINMENENSWGEGVTVYGINEGDGYGWKGTEFKLDGINDYIEVYPSKDMNIETGFTFEFYAKSDSVYVTMLCKTLKGNTDPKVFLNKFRTAWNNMTETGNGFQCCMSMRDCESDWKRSESAEHWIKKDNIGTMNSEKGGYLTMTADIKNNIITLYWNGDIVGATTCSHQWMIDGGLTDNTIPFTIGLQVGGDSYQEVYSQIDIYACRLYNKVLTIDEVKDNYTKTVDYHNMLVGQK